VYHELTPTDRKIFEWRTGYNGVKKLQAQQIAKKLGVSAGAVSQRTSKIADRLAQGMKFKEAL
jgi:DNA-directed RNA polymerase specialized sigma subunit